MVDTKSKNEQIPNTRQQSKNEITPKKSLRHKDIDKMTLKQSLRFKNMDEMPLKENDMFSCSSNKTTEKPVIIKLYHSYLKFKIQTRIQWRMSMGYYDEG